MQANIDITEGDDSLKAVITFPNGLIAEVIIKDFAEIEILGGREISVLPRADNRIEIKL
jgi:hypothetical protein